MNQWGRQEEKIVWISSKQDGVIEAIQIQNRGITNISVNIPREGDDLELEPDWGAVGRCFGHSKHLKHLKLPVNTNLRDDCLLSFCRELSINTSLESIYFDFSGCSWNKANQVIDNILPLFRNNTNLKKITFAGVLPNNAGDAIDVCSSLQSVHVKNVRGERNWGEVAMEAICRKVEQLSFTGFLGPLPSHACEALKNNLTDENCALKH
jgi:hypothetical protein